MLKNLVFDFGNVVVRFDPDYMVSTVTDIAEEKEILKRTVFNPITFELTDRGYVTLEKHIATVLPEVPTALHEKAVKLLREWYLNLPVVSGMEELLLDAKKSGYKLFLLSNINSHFGTHRNEVQILSLFDGLVLSSDIHFIKPEPEIYLHLLSKFNLSREECLFIDDRQINIDGAEAVGIKGYLFDGAEKLRDYLKL